MRWAHSDMQRQMHGVAHRCAHKHKLSKQYFRVLPHGVLNAERRVQRAITSASKLAQEEVESAPHACLCACELVPQLLHGSAYSDAGLLGCRTPPVGSASLRLPHALQVACCCTACACMVLCQGPCSEQFYLHSIVNVSDVRADYEVDFITFFTRLTGTKMGAKFNDEAYLVPIKIDVPKL